ncbi:5-carboxymethyl-2-hydroxymuconate Delta-isomerase [Bacillus sp. REN10]|uniref:5-carboxymethyl-2-hydroxymuconate Delta-isomerase n=1 Tax=Bacillus sp. REN10 TaxID=2782541 RepID=UPI00193BFA76|nr:5-carboxymethyl-2-hydroxymuconate Delta-isomerase [Bacillus sp. REN10]
MPHIIIEYTDNIRIEGNIPLLLTQLHQVLINRSDLFPIGGIRSRAIELHDYRVADGMEDDAFVHMTLKIGAGRSEADKQAVCNELFQVMKQHFNNLFANRYLALSMEVIEFSEAGTYKHNNIHNRFKKGQSFPH